MTWLSEPTESGDRRTRWVRRIALALGVSFAAISAPIARRQQDFVVLEPPQEAIIHYNDSDDLKDPATELKKKIDSGKLKLAYDDQHGYLKAVLKALKIPESSQCLVFSKTSAQIDLISPKTPRAIYIGDDAYVAEVQGSEHLELAAVDPKKGAVFYTMVQDPGGRPAMKRHMECMRCHNGPKTLGAPGFLVRSSLTKSNGVAMSQVLDFVSGHNSPLSMRWGGWYVTGTSENDVHDGNSFLEDPLHPERFDPRKGSNVTTLTDRFDTTKYLRPTSDIVALMVLDDGVRMHDLITHARYETLFAQDERKRGDVAPGWPERRIANAGEYLLAYMLFRDEAKLKGPLKGTSGFDKDFEKPGPRDRKGRSLRDFDLETRMFRYPCNYLIYSEAFKELPDEMKTYLWGRLVQILSGQDQTPTYKTMASADRRNVKEILLDTKPDFKRWCLKNAPQFLLGASR